MSIKNYKNWLVWERKDRPTSALTGQQSGWNRNLSTYAEAAEFCQNNPTYNIGLCFSDDLPFVGLDLDACVGENGMEQWAKDIVLTLADSIIIDNTSVSGTGHKVVVKCSEKLKRGVKFIEAEQHGDHKPQVELFAPKAGSAGKFFALTSPLTITEDANEVDTNTLSEIMGFNVTEVVVPKTSNATSGDITAEELKELLSKLDVHDFEDRDEWIRMLAAAHHGTGGSDEGKEAFKEWSAGDPDNYSEWHTVRDWDSQRTDVANPITIGTLIAKIAPEERPRIDPADDFDVVPMAKSTPLLGWLLNETARNHASVVNQFAADPEGEVVRFVSDWDCWIIFDGVKWQRDDKGGRFHQIIMEFIQKLSERIPDDGDGEQGAKAMGWISSLLNYNNTMGVLRQARGTRGLITTVAEMGDNPFLLNFANGTYDLENDVFRGHRPEDYCFYVCDTNYVADAKAPLWEKVLTDVFAGDNDLVEYTRRMFGNGVSGDTSDPLFYILYGSGANGKSTIVQTISGLLGEYSTDLPSELFDKNATLHPTYMAKLHKSRLAVVAEMESDVSLAEATIKKVTSQDAIEARRMRENPWSFKPTHTSVLCTNHKPSVRGSDVGIWRRLRLLPFEVNLSDRKDVTIPARLQLEYAGIANWLIQGYRDCKANGGVGSCAAVDKATEDYRLGEDEFQRIAEDLFVQREKASLTAVDAFQAYAQTGGRLGRKKFIAEMGRIGYKQTRIRVNGSQPNGFAGLTLASLVSEF